MSFIGDIAALAKAGYTAQDVKDLMQLSKSQEPLKAEAQPAEQKADSGPEPARIITEPEKGAEVSPKESEQPEPEPDYKALYEAEQEKVKSLQNKNNSVDVSQSSQSKEKDLLEAIRSFC